MSSPVELPSQPNVLLVPVSGPGGAGEYFRALALASGIERRWPGARIRLVASRDAQFAAHSPYPVIFIDRSPTYETRAVNEILARERPDVAIFDSSGRVGQYRVARRQGTRVVFLSSRASTRRKGFRLRRMRWIDQHWIAQPRFFAGDLTALERLKQRMLGGPEVLFLEVLHEPLDEVGATALQREHGLQAGRYILVCPGGGGRFADGPDAVPVFHEAACRIAQGSGVPLVAVLGSHHVPSPASGVHVLSALPNGVLMALLRDARIAVLNGGSLLIQAIAQRTPAVAAPIAADQPGKIALCAQEGYVRGAPLSAAGLADTALALHADEEALAALRSRLTRLDLRNGVDVAVQAMERWFPASTASVARDPGAGTNAPSRAGGRLRIMHVILSYGFAGSERAAAEAANAMSAAHDVALVIREDHRSDRGGSIRDHLVAGVEVIEVPARLTTRLRLDQAVRSWRPDVIHTHLRRGTRLIAQIEPHAAHVASLHLSINGSHFLKTDGLLCISDWQVATVPKDYRGKVYLIPNSLVPARRLEPARIAALRAELGAPGGEFLIGGVGRLARSKGFDVLLRAFEQAAIPDARLAIVGDGRERRSLERLKGERVLLTGYRADAKDCFQAFDLFVSSSRSEPFGRVIIEALDGGAPVVATDAQGPTDIARHYPIELVAGDDVAALAAALVKAAARPRARVRIDLGEFHIDRIVAKTLDAYREVIERRSQSGNR